MTFIDLLSVPTADMIINWVRARRCQYPHGNTVVRMGVNLAPKYCELLSVPGADLSIASVRVRSIGVDYNIVMAKLMFAWG